MDLFKVQNRINLKFFYNGTDSATLCHNIKHFYDYKKLVSYTYNSKGFRDEEWPSDIKDKIWCVGDSFTVGIGQPYEEIWPKLLEKQLGERCINISEDGCSNDLMALRIEQIQKNFQPKYIVVMWSYFWRRWINNTNVHFDESKRELPKNDLDNFCKNLQLVNNNGANQILNYVIPDCMIETVSTRKHMLDFKNKKNIKRFINFYYPDNQFPDIREIEQIDYARDGHHFDVLTCKKVVEDILKNFASTAKTPPFSTQI
jgi:hypothetical protein